MIKGIGVDIVEIDRVKKAMGRHKTFASRIFTAGERAYCEAQTQPNIHFAARFAAKEAAVKALGTGFTGMKFTDLEVCRDTLGKPFLKLSGSAAKVAHDLGICDIYISLSFSRECAVASAIAIGTEASPCGLAPLSSAGQSAGK